MKRRLAHWACLIVAMSMMVLGIFGLIGYLPMRPDLALVLSLLGTMITFAEADHDD